eukprot:IDg20038t1
MRSTACFSHRAIRVLKARALDAAAHRRYATRCDEHAAMDMLLSARHAIISDRSIACVATGVNRGHKPATCQERGLCV